jgi:hypothetical protein
LERKTGHAMGKKKNRNGTPDIWQAGGPQGSANGSCDVKNGGGKFGPNAFNFGVSRKRRGGRNLLRLAATLLVLVPLVAVVVAVLLSVLHR